MMEDFKSFRRTMTDLTLIGTGSHEGLVVVTNDQTVMRVWANEFYKSKVMIVGVSNDLLLPNAVPFSDWQVIVPERSKKGNKWGFPIPKDW